MNAYPFPRGKFSESEWRASFSLFMSQADAEAEARDRANIGANEAERTTISEVDLAYLSLVSDDLAKRVDDYRREVSARPFIPLDDVGLAEEREKKWIELKDHLRRGLQRG
jgi:hypothetical protein